MNDCSRIVGKAFLYYRALMHVLAGIFSLSHSNSTTEIEREKERGDLHIYAT